MLWWSMDISDVEQMPSLGVVLLIKDAGPFRAHLDSGEDQKSILEGNPGADSGPSLY